MLCRKEYLIMLTICAGLPGVANSADAASSSPTTDGNLQLLGNGILSRASVTAPFKDAGVEFTPRPHTSYSLITYGAGAGTNVSESYSLITSGSRSIWRRTGAPGHETDFVITPDGVFKTRLTNPDHQLVFEYTPGEPEVIAGMAPGESRQFTYSVRAAKQSDLTQTEATGQINVDFSYLGQFQVTTPAGTITAHGFNKVLTGKIGPTNNNTSLYVFYAAGFGEVARIDHTDIHALMLYNRDSRTAYLLQKLPDFIGP